MLYCHDTYGLGHLKRTLTLANYLGACRPSSSQFIVTGSPVAHGFPYPARTDYVKLPSVVKVGAGKYESRHVSMPFTDILEVRREMLLSVGRHFRPDALLVDHSPGGLGGEVVDTLRYLKQTAPQSRLILGLRDIVDEGPRVRKAWTREGVYELLDDMYDRILVYGSEQIFDVVSAYCLSARAAAKTHYVGYLRREPGARSATQIRTELHMQTDRLVVVTAGGGGDGYELFRAVLDALRLRSGPVGFDCVLILGPLMSASDRDNLRELTFGRASVHVLDFTPDAASYIGAADVVVSMGGYNTVCEILSFERPAIVVPRVAPRKEQLIRAQALHERGLIRMIPHDHLSPRRLLDELNHLLKDPPRMSGGLSMDGLAAVAEELQTLLTPSRLSPRGGVASAPVGARRSASAM